MYRRFVTTLAFIFLFSMFVMAQAVITPSGFATTGGAAIPVAPVGTPLLIYTPVIQLNDAPKTPSIHLGRTSAGNTGITTVGMESAQSEAESAAGPRPSIDLGVNSNEVIVDDGTNGRSLGEIAHENRLRKSSSNAHVYTNDEMVRAAAAARVSGVSTPYQSFGQSREAANANRP